MADDVKVGDDPDGGFCVMAADGSILARGFDSHSAAWRWIDRNTGEAGEDEDRSNRIRNAFSER